MLICFREFWLFYVGALINFSLFSWLLFKLTEFGFNALLTTGKI